MKKILNEILDSIKLNKNDTHRWGETPINIIKTSEFLQNSDNNFENLRKYLIDEIKFHKIEISHTSKYSPEIFHENVSLSREYELEVLEKISNMIDNNNI